MTSKQWIATADNCDIVNATAEDGGTAIAGHSGIATAGNGGTAVAGDFGVATAGDDGTAVAGDIGTATAGCNGTATAGHLGAATAGDDGTAVAGDFGVAVAGYGGTATAGAYGKITITFWCFKELVFKTVAGHVGYDGILPNVPYHVHESTTPRCPTKFSSSFKLTRRNV